jgi:hypothetical protein
MRWFIENRQDLAKYISYFESPGDHGHGHRLLAIPSRDRLERVLKYVLDENEFLSPYGVRSLSRYHREHPFVLHAGGEEHRVEYTPGESHDGTLRRQLQLARPDLDAAQLPAGRGARALSSLSTATRSRSSARRARGV